LLFDGGRGTGADVKIGALILVGGASSRMGRDKASLDWNGRHAVDRLAELVASLGISDVVTAGAGDYGLPSVVEAPPRSGPVGGIAAGLAALGRLGCERALVLAVDAPTLTASDIAPLLNSGPPGAAYEGLHLPLVVDLAATRIDVEPGWPVARFIGAVGLFRPPCPRGAALRLRGANTEVQRQELLAELASRP